MKHKNSKKVSTADVNFLSQVQGTLLFAGNRADTYLQLLNGLLGVLLVLVIGNLANYYRNLSIYSEIGGGIICFTIFICLVINLVSIMPKEKDGAEKRTNIFFFRSIHNNLSSWQNYSEELKKTISTKDSIVDAYAYEIWNLGKVELRKFNHIKTITRLLLTGLSIGSFFILMSFLL